MIVLVQHHVKDFDAWHRVFTEHEAMRRRHGATSHRLYRGGLDGNAVTVISEFPTRAQAEAFTADPSLPEAMAKAGVDGEPRVEFLDAVESVDYRLRKAV